MRIEPVTGLPFTFHVYSETNPGTFHVVDWLASPASCSCNAYAYRHRQHELDTQTPFLCKHLIASRDHCWGEILESTRETLLAQ